MNAGSSSSSAKPAIVGWMQILGRRILQPLIPSLENISDEDIANEPFYKIYLIGPVASIVYSLIGLVLWFAVPSFHLFGVSSKWIGIGVITLGVILFFWSYQSLRLAVRVRARATAQVSMRAPDASSYRDEFRIRAQRSEFEKRLSERNLGDRFLLKSMHWSAVAQFEDGEYRLASRVNVLLGKNGYGKTLLLRTLAAVAQRDDTYSGLMFPKGDISAPPEQRESSGRHESAPETPRTPEPPWMILEITRNGSLERVVRDATYFEDSVGKIPMLAIPDLRFVNRAQKAIAATNSAVKPLSTSGADEFRAQEPFDNAVHRLLAKIALDYLESRERPLGQVLARGFDQPIFRLIEEVVRGLTDDREFQFASIRRSGDIGFEILVRTCGSTTEAIPIQAASQGTLSVIVIFGFIYNFLESLLPSSKRGEDVTTTPGIVIIDEVDAHMHPSWQQKIMGMLTAKFPNVQYIVSAHSPLIVAGCDQGEVSVLRRRSSDGRFFIDPLPGDFLGISAAELYKRAFEIDDIDRLYLEYSTKGMGGREEVVRDIKKLQERQGRSKVENDRLEMSQRELRLIDRADEVRQQKLESERARARITMLEREVERLRTALDETQGGGARAI